VRNHRVNLGESRFLSEEENRRLKIVEKNFNDHYSTRGSGISALRVGEVDRRAKASARTRGPTSRKITCMA
jgi:hypothetical protein